MVVPDPARPDPADPGRARTARQIRLHRGRIFGITFLAPLIVWLANLGLVPWLTLTAVQALVFALAAMPLPRLIALPGWPLYTAAWWVVVEAVRGRAPLGGFPWGRLAFGQADAPYASWATVGGGPALSFAVAFLGSLLAYGLRAWRGGCRQVSAAVCLGAVALITTPLALPGPGTSGTSAVVAVSGWSRCRNHLALATDAAGAKALGRSLIKGEALTRVRDNARLALFRDRWQADLLRHEFPGVRLDHLIAAHD
ncbi:hypothetical protein ACQEVY_20755 [Streptomyces sp. CA-288835]|uniref:hypothetical protein n=1 Tax=Streptomyces sp. CA-288835 TaxID=3240069 RepID=UPI003D8CD1BC